MGHRGNVQFNMPVQMTPVVKWLIISCVAIWLVLQVVVEKYLLGDLWITGTLALIPHAVFDSFHIWQLATYQFVHSFNPFHILFNMLLLWWLGSELESRWGSKLFLSYYLASGIGAGLIYLVVLWVWSLSTGSISPAWTTPVVGASGAVFGLMLAYGILFGERIVYFLMVFPMRAKWFVMILGAVEVATILNSGIGGSGEANLAHLGGLASGFLFLRAYTWWKQRNWRKRGGGGRRGPGLKLVVNNDKSDGDGPKYWS
jgi:membrane associated rhomboid family serine protease